MGKILVIGANGSVGKSCVNNLKDDNDLVLISRSEFDSDVEGNFEKNVLDINDYTNTESFIKSINYEISGIIFAIGSINLKPFSSTSVDDFKKIMDDNFYNIVHFLNHCITKMSDSSSVVFFSSIAAVRGFKNHTAISSAKSALIGLSNSLAADYAPKIRFNTISPSHLFPKCQILWFLMKRLLKELENFTLCQDLEQVMT